MSEIPVEAARQLFIRRWGEMGDSWGISRTMAEIHALLYLATESLCTDDVMDRLAVSRGSASTNLRALVNWGLVHRVHRRGDRKEYFEAETDVWQMSETIFRERRRREVQPIVETLQRCLELVDEGQAKLKGRQRKDAEITRKRFRDILEFGETMNTLANLMTKIGRKGIKPIIAALRRLIG